jgi:hypothetical protein
MDAKPGLIRLDNNLATIDYSRNAQASMDAIQRCPTGAIVWLSDGQGTKGREAKKIFRIEALPVSANVV